ncbi:MAG: DUF5106 domain-containing protein [Muribaculaceae bacterium]|nr:DUF5106 domain-containing protein [Muribaculaceae bacterium]
MKKIINLSIAGMLIAGAYGTPGQARNVGYEFPTIPSTLTAPGERAGYLIAHYWDNLNFSPSEMEEEQKEFEQVFVDFLSVMPYVTSDQPIEEGFAGLIKTAENSKNAAPEVREIVETYLCNADSPMRSDRHYLAYLRALAAAGTLTETERYRVADRIEMTSKNMTGEPATDFTFETPDGKEETLKRAVTASEETVVIFFDPDCENCTEVMDLMAGSGVLAEKIARGERGVLAIYSGDDHEAWRRKTRRYPENWIFGINREEIEENDLYYFPTMPTIYLIGRDGKIIDKELPPSCVVE